jgi:hypothetical protein
VRSRYVTPTARITVADVAIMARARWLRPPSGAGSASGRVTPTPVDMYDVMGTLTVHGRTIPSARLTPSEYALINWMDDLGLHVNEIRPAEGRPAAESSLLAVVRGWGSCTRFLFDRRPSCVSTGNPPISRSRQDEGTPFVE